VNSLLAFIDRLFNKHQLIRRTSFFAAWLGIAAITYAVLMNLGAVNAYSADVLKSILLICSLVVGYYHYKRSQ